MALKKELKIALIDVQEVLRGLGDIHPFNKMDVMRKGLASKAISEVVPDCVDMIKTFFGVISSMFH